MHGYTEAIIVEEANCWGILNLRFCVYAKLTFEYVLIEDIHEALTIPNPDTLATILLPHITQIIEVSEPLLEELMLNRLKSNFGLPLLYDYLLQSCNS